MMKWSTRNRTWISGPYALERQRVPLHLSDGRQEFRYEITREGDWIGHALYLSDAKRFAEAHAAQLQAGVITR